MNCNVRSGLCVWLVVGCVASGCTAIPIHSKPEGARIFMDGVDTGQVTPGNLRVGDLPVGRHKITVQKDGFRMVNPPPSVRIKVEPSEIAVSIVLFPVAFPWNLFDNRWKVADPRSLIHDGLTIQLEEGSAPPVAPEAAPPVKPDQAVDPAAVKGQTVADRLRQLEQLKKEGLITEQEFDSKRKALIDQL